MNVDEAQLRAYVDQVFVRYDPSNKGSMGFDDLHLFLNELFTLTGMNRTVTNDEAYNAFTRLDKNRDGQITREELFQLFKTYMMAPTGPNMASTPGFMVGAPGPTLVTSTVGPTVVSSGVTHIGQSIVAPTII